MIFFFFLSTIMSSEFLLDLSLIRCLSLSNLVKVFHIFIIHNYRILSTNAGTFHTKTPLTVLQISKCKKRKKGGSKVIKFVKFKLLTYIYIYSFSCFFCLYNLLVINDLCAFVNVYTYVNI